MDFRSHNKTKHFKHKAWLLLGANLGDAAATFSKACVQLEKKDVRILSKSALYQSKAWGEGVQGVFFNQALEVLTNQAPLAFLKELHAIETSLGRKRMPGVIGSRPIDIDILFFDDAVVSLPALVIPHPRLHLRRFALMPLCEIAPGLKHPLLGMTVKELLQATGDNLLVEKA